MRRPLIEALANPDHHEALREFLRLWYGVKLPSPPPSPPPSARVPAVLRALLALEESEPIAPYIRLFEPKEVADGLLVFAAEYAGVYHWAYRPGEPDPIVWGCWPEWEDLEPRAVWPPEQERHRHSRLREFLVELCAFNAVWMSPKSLGIGLTMASREAQPEGLGPLEPVLDAWHWPSYPTRFLVSDRGLGFAYPGLDGRREDPVLHLTEYDLAHRSHVAPRPPRAAQTSAAVWDEPMPEPNRPTPPGSTNG